MSAIDAYRLADVMRIFGYRDADSFRAARRRFEALGFPQPLPGCTRPLKWSREEVDAWRRNPRPAQSALKQAAPAPANDAAPSPASDDEIAQARARILARAGA